MEHVGIGDALLDRGGEALALATDGSGQTVREWRLSVVGGAVSDPGEDGAPAGEEVGATADGPQEAHPAAAESLFGL